MPFDGSPTDQPKIDILSPTDRAVLTSVRSHISQKGLLQHSQGNPSGRMCLGFAITYYGQLADLPIQFSAQNYQLQRFASILGFISVGCMVGFNDSVLSQDVVLARLDAVLN